MIMKKNYLIAVVLLLALPIACLANQVYGQTIVLWEKGKTKEGKRRIVREALPGTLVILESETHGRFYGVSNLLGQYRIPNLPSGLYRVKSFLECFPNIMVENYSPGYSVFLRVGGGKRVRLNINILESSRHYDWIGGTVILEDLPDHRNMRSHSFSRRWLKRLPVR